MQRFSLYLSLLGLTIICGVTNVGANKKPADKVTKVSFNELSETHELYKQLYSEKKNVVVETIKRVDSKISAGEYRGIEGEISRVINSGLYRDYGLWLDAQYRLERARKSYEQKHYVSTVTHAQRGIRRLLQIREESPQSPLFTKLVKPIVDSELIIAVAFAKRKRKKEASVYFERAFARIKKEWRMSQIMYHMPLSYMLQYVDICRSKFSEECKYWIDGIIGSLPSHSAEFKKLNSTVPKNLRDKSRSKTYARSYRWYPAESEDQIEYNKAIEFYFDGKYRSATRAFDKFLEDYDSSRLKQRALYWKARTLQKRRRRKDAKKLFEKVIEESPTNYYAILSANHLGIDLTKKINPIIPKIRMIDDSLVFWEKRSILRAVNFVKSGLDEYGTLELDHLRTRSTLPNEYLFGLASLANETSSFYRSFHFLIELYARKYDELISPYGIRLSFPFAFQDVIQKHADAEKVDPVLVLSLIKQESAFKDAVVSRSNAVGLMQLRLFTAADVDGKVSFMDLRKPDRNVLIGTKYLGSLLKRFDENIVYSLAGYNAGPSRIVRWRKAAKSSWDMAEFVESIPYEETQKYVISIIRNYFWYNYRLTGEGMPNLDYFWGKTKGWEPAKLKEETSVRNLSVSQLKSNP